MENNKIKLTETDFLAISKNDMNYINNKGASLYCEPTYKESVEYYRLAAIMGSKHQLAIYVIAIYMEEEWKIILH